MQLSTLARAAAAALALAFGGVAAEAAPVELTFANALSLPQVEPYQKAIDEFNAANPDIHVTMLNAPWSEYWQQRQVDTASGKLPDVWLFVPGFGAQWLYGDQLLPLDDYIAKDPGINLPDANQTMLKYMTLNGKLYGIGYDFNGVAIFYNPALFEEAGVPLPKDGWTTDDFANAAKTISTKLSKDGRKVWGLAGIGTDWVLDGWYRAFGTTMIGADGKYDANNDAGRATIQFFADMVKDGVAPIPDQKDSSGQAQSLFISGNLAMALGVGHTVTILDDAGVDYNIARLPVGPAGQAGVGLGGSYVISAATPHKDEAFKFLSYITSGPVLAKVVTTGVPARESAWSNLSEHMADFAKKIQGFAAFNAPKGSFQVMDLQNQVLSGVWNGSVDVPTAMNDLTQKADAALAAAAGN
ncbi:sugar ABC transporter substrate-binding protein [Mesorhizobium sp. BR1-1-16]|uniref:ABC transporter substrate-binding protein n=1 Tax=Mesorhizobium sp. BR1-1-16 TaxID=2876653 RepID=UPI001CCD5E93|nr:sugar ABC transporter substrate-binding protein [Mesorhizobium sp. BR1-1-16]MBZ9939319.1 sugar ABC transporter substrate-binding protein [Mesorhizobium sp. BR1-1-16]